MTLQSSGQISIANIDDELGRAHSSSDIGSSSPRSLAGVRSGAISLSDFYGKFLPFTVVAYGIGGGGGSRFDTSGGSGGGGAVVKQFTMSPSGITGGTIVVGGGGYNNSNGGTSYISTNQFTAYAYGGTGNPYGPPCGNCLGGPGVSGGGASGGDLNLAGGGGSGWNQYYVEDNTCYDFKGRPYSCPSYNQYPGFDGASGVLNGSTYYAAGGGGGGSDLVSYNPGGAGGYYAGSGGTGVHSGSGSGGNAYGGGSGGAGNYHGGAGRGAQGVFVLQYTSPTQRISGGTATTATIGGVINWTHTFTRSANFSVI
jgi:hypothetical protein